MSTDADILNPEFPAAYEKEGRDILRKLEPELNNKDLIPLQVCERNVVNIPNQIRRAFGILPGTTLKLTITHVMGCMGKTKGKDVFVPAKECIPHISMYTTLQKNGKTITLPENVVSLLSLKPKDIILTEISGVTHESTD